jgi:hypothetical protein
MGLKTNSRETGHTLTTARTAARLQQDTGNRMAGPNPGTREGRRAVTEDRLELAAKASLTELERRFALSLEARLAGPGGARSVVAESVLVKHPLLINRARKRSPAARQRDEAVRSVLRRPTR